MTRPHASQPPHFAPRPPNDFKRFYECYYEACRQRMPRIQALAAKWCFEDLIPGLSDFDTRFIVADGMSVRDWCAMSTAVGAVHLDLCRRYPQWARNLEHLPGINLTWAELNDPDRYYPEYPQWTFYRTEDPGRLAATRAYLAGRPWGLADRIFHLKKFCLFYGRYDRRIDPPVNLGLFENKYALHSRFMHYFCPPLQSALCLLLQRPVAGKMESIRLACEMFADPVFREMRDAVACHYEVPALYVEPEQTRLEDRLASALDRLRRELAPGIEDLVPGAGRSDVKQWQEDLGRAPVSPVMKVFDASRFSRLMKGRLEFYARAPKHFDAAWLIDNELRRLKRNFFDIPFGTFWETISGEKVADPAAIVPHLVPEWLQADEAQAARAFARLTAESCEPGRRRARALDIAAVFDGFFSSLNRVAQSLAARRHDREAAPGHAREARRRLGARTDPRG